MEYEVTFIWPYQKTSPISGGNPIEHRHNKLVVEVDAANPREAQLLAYEQLEDTYAAAAFGGEATDLPPFALSPLHSSRLESIVTSKAEIERRKKIGGLGNGVNHYNPFGQR